MKKVKFIAIIAVIALTLPGLKACKESGRSSEGMEDSMEMNNHSQHGSHGDGHETAMDGSALEQHTGFPSALLKQYLEIKNALAGDNSTEAAKAATGFNQLLDEMQPDSLPAEKQDEVVSILQQARIHSEQISAKGIAEQRENFAELSQSMISLVRLTGTEFTLYEQFCPMYSNNEGGAWLSTTEKIQNPYFGSSMLSCGAVRKEYSPNMQGN